MAKFWIISESGFPDRLTVVYDRDDLGMALRFLSWTTGRLKLLSTELWKEQVLGEDQMFSFGHDRFEITVRCARGSIGDCV